MKNFSRGMKLLMAASLTVGALNLTACTDEEVATTIGIGAIIGGAILIGANSHCVAGYKQVCHDFRDFRGRIRSECREEYDSCATTSLNAVRNVQDAQSGALDQVVSDVNWGKTFGMSYQSSGQLISSLKDAGQGDTKALENLGLSSSDTKKLASLQLPSDDGVRAVAFVLDTDKTVVKNMFGQLIQTIRDNQEQIQAP